MVDVISYLEDISKVGEGQTYNVHTRSIITYKSLYGWYSRYTGGEDRFYLENWLIQLYGSAFYKCDRESVHIDSNPIFIAIKESLKGLLNILHTYINVEGPKFEDIVYDVELYIDNKEGSIISGGVYNYYIPGSEYGTNSYV